jgi:hypothetical protein
VSWKVYDSVRYIGQLGRMNGSCKVCCVPTLSSLDPSDHVRSINAYIYIERIS